MGVLKVKGGVGTFATSVAMDGTTTVVGSPWVNNNAGAVYVFEGSKMVATLTSPDSVEAFGLYVAVSGHTIVVTSYSGGAFVYVEPQGGWIDSGKETATLNGGGPVAVSGNIILAGQGIFVEPQDGWGSTRTPDAYLDFQPQSVALSEDGTVAVIGNSTARNKEQSWGDCGL